ncbi:DUF1402 family protein [Aureimonas sp. AU20]|uniref:DUF1402 family protein n=1 Tax=Aureimonas sp. AU20 TaxID=1349819 RepID=UPI0007216742|nr:DUF1402 family protein [Aureimonas sp. AU20]ALN71476.1 hypothetical protein M673_02060 [Aureimonas sp. AU20]
MSRFLAAVLAGFLLVHPAQAQSVVTVPPGNRNATQPAIPSFSYTRTAATGGNFDAKYKKIRELLATNRDLQTKIRSAARLYGIDPIHIAGALVGEHTFNVDALDRLQTYYVKAMSYLNSGIDFSYKGESVESFVARPEFERCKSARGDEALWSCREQVFEQSFRGKTVDGRSYPDNRFGAVFFQPYYAGQTFGLGQINPMTALAVSDIVHRVSGYPDIDMGQAGEVYAAIMDPDKSLHYMAAVIRSSIDKYRDIAGFDISKNPGVTATLYNVGDPITRARRLKAENIRRKSNGQAPRMPEENYYGWLVNEKLDDLRKIFPAP